MRPVLQRYNVTWVVGIVLRIFVLAKWLPKEAIFLKQPSLKTVALVVLSSDRAQSIHALRADYAQFSDEDSVFCYSLSSKNILEEVLPHLR